MEMDELIKYTVTAIEAQDKIRLANDSSGGELLPTLFVLLSDHGMTDSGNHGGSTKQETYSVLLMVGADLQSNLNEEDPIPLVMQVDMVPSLSILLGLPIPRSSIGKLIPGLGFTKAEYDILSTHLGCKKGDDQCLQDTLDRATSSGGDDINEIQCIVAIALSLSSCVLVWYGIFAMTGEPTALNSYFQVLTAHSLAMFSSSYVENEHALVYFITSSLMARTLVMAYQWGLVRPEMQRPKSKTQKVGKNAMRVIVDEGRQKVEDLVTDYVYGTVGIMIIVRVLWTRNTIINFGRLNSLEGASDSDTESVLPSQFGGLAYYCLGAAIMMSLHRLYRNADMLAIHEICGFSLVLLSKLFPDVLLFPQVTFAVVLLSIVACDRRTVAMGLLFLVLLLHREGNTFPIFLLYAGGYLLKFSASNPDALYCKLNTTQSPSLSLSLSRSLSLSAMLRSPCILTSPMFVSIT